MSSASVLRAAEKPAAAAPRYALLLSRDPAIVEEVQRLRYEVFTSEPGFVLAGSFGNGVAGLDADHFDEYCDHLLVRDCSTGELVGCYRMLSPAAANAAGGLYMATEFDISELAPLRPSLVEMGRAVVRDGHRSGAVVLLMWRGILAYLDRSGYDFVIGCVSVPIQRTRYAIAGEEVRGVRDLALRSHTASYRVRPYRPVVVGGKLLDEIAAPARLAVPPLMRAYLRLGANICGEPAHDPDFAVADFPALLDKRKADIRYLERLRSAAKSADGYSG
ncbi:MAG TPA: GNAT family N-acyltransferase [Mycobacterium sp.]|jgi:putative hemolysin